MNDTAGPPGLVVFLVLLTPLTGQGGEWQEEILREAERDLLVLASFDGTLMAKTSWGTAIQGNFARNTPAARWDGTLVERGEPRFQQGRFGAGIYLEKGTLNFFRENQGHVEAGLQGFAALGDAELRQSTDDRWQGRASLEVRTARGGGVETAEVSTLTIPLRGHESVRIFAASVFLKGVRGGEKVSLELVDVASLREAAPKLHAELTRGKTKDDGPAPDDLEALVEDEQRDGDQTGLPAEGMGSPFAPKGEKRHVTLSTRWRRHYARVQVPRQRTRHRLRFRILSGDQTPIRFLADGFQLEQSGEYPHYRAATSWTPGRTERAAETFSLPLREIRFPAKEGAISVWANPLSWWGAEEVGACVLLSIGALNRPVWVLPQSYRVTVKGGSAFFNLKHRPAVNQFHHFLLNWDEDLFQLFINGQLEASGKVGKKPITTRLLHIGLNCSNHQNANAVIDEFAIFRRPLTSREVEAIHGSPRPLRLKAGLALEELQNRWVFFRDEPTASLRFRVHGGPGSRRPRVQTELLQAGHPLPGLAAEAEPSPAGEVTFDFSPQKLAAGQYSLKLTLVDRPYSFPVVVVPAFNTARYLTQIWQGPTDDRSLASLGKMGLAILDTSRWASDRTLMDRLARHGLQLCAHQGTLRPISSLLHPEACVVKQDGRRTKRLCANHPTVIQAAEESMRHRLKALRPYPHVKLCLLNSEVNNRPCFAESCMQRMQADLGFRWPERLRIGAGSRILFNAKEEPVPHVVDGVVKDDDPYYLTLKWRHGPGSLSPHHRAVGAALKGALDAKIVHDPAFQLPWVHTRFDGVDVIQHWSYSPALQMNLLNLKGLLCDARGRKMTSMILGMVWPRATYERNGKKELAAQSPDCLRESMWLVLSQPVDMLSFWAWRETPPPGHEASYEEVRRMFAEVVRPHGPAIRKMKAVPNAAATLYSTCSQLFYQYPWYFTWGYTRTFNQTLLKHNVPLDVIYEQDVIEGALGRYRALFIPVNVALPGSVHRKIVEFARSGKLVVADRFLKADIPSVHRLDIHLGSPAYLAPVKTIVEKVSAYCPEIKRRLQPYVDTPTPNVFVAAKEYGGVRYVFVINDKRHAGTSMDYTGDRELAQKLLPDGIAQAAEIVIRTPGAPVIYDVLSHQTVPYEREDDKLKFALSLGPSEGKMLAIYPEAIDEVPVAVSGELRRGGRLQLTASVQSVGRKPMPGTQSLQVEVVDAQGRSNDYSGYYATDRGRFELEIPVALNEPSGKWAVTVRELTTGLSVSREFTVR